MAYSTKEGDEQETMYRFLTPGETEQSQVTNDDPETNRIGRELHRISTIYMSLVTPNQPNEDPPLYKCLTPCLLVTGFGIGSALVILFFYMGFAYGIDEGIMVGLFAFASWLYALVTYCKKIGFFRPLEVSVDSTPSSLATIVIHNGQDPPSYKEVTGSPPSYQEALKMIKAIQNVGHHQQLPVVTNDQTPQVVVVSNNTSKEHDSSFQTRL